jgi:hypothetical protein
MGTLPPPSKEQKSAIDAISSGHCVTIPSVAGSGKTTCMLQIAASLPKGKKVTIVTYNRALSDECKERIVKCGLQGNASCYTIHGLVGRVAQKVCNDDTKLINVVNKWDNSFADGNVTMSTYNTNISPISLDLLILDEAQDIRPCFYRALCHIIRMSSKTSLLKGIQMCLVGDPKQMLYNFPTFGNDKASTQYMEDPERYWGDFTSNRTWVRKKLTVSYRLTPKNAAFVNAVWGTSIEGGNTKAEDIPVEYINRYPYPPTSENSNSPDHLETAFLKEIIDEHGEENVMFLAQSVKNETCPIRVHVNELMKEKDTKGKRKYNFHIKESLRGFEGNKDIQNKVRVWTFCGSKGCEADCVVVFGFDMFKPDRVVSLNQMGVALSRARKRLIVIHGKVYIQRKFVSYPYYPMLGNSEEGLLHSMQWNGNTYQYKIPPLKQRGSIDLRSKLTQRAMSDLAQNKVICLKKNSLPTMTGTKVVQVVGTFYEASDFNYFAAAEEEKFLSYGLWDKESGVIDRIEYTVDVQFDKTKENVSALYGEAVVYMLQWQKAGFCPNIETIVNNGILRFNSERRYDESLVCELLEQLNCEPLSHNDNTILHNEFKMNKGYLRGKNLISFLNDRISLKKKRYNGTQIIYFPVRAVDDKEDDVQMRPFQLQIKSIYEGTKKTSANWIYLANAVMAFRQYHDKWNQVGTDPDSYEKWTESSVLREGLSRLTKLMEKATTRKEHLEGGAFERKLEYKFLPKDCLEGNGVKILGVQGICDWTGEGLVSLKGKQVDILEIKFVNELGNVNRLQVLVYCALLSIEYKRSCSGMLYNARTGELEVCSILLERAESFLLDISQFKKNGTKRQVSQPTLQRETSIISTSSKSATTFNDSQLLKKEYDKKPYLRTSIATSTSESIEISPGEKRKRQYHSSSTVHKLLSANPGKIYDSTVNSEEGGIVHLKTEKSGVDASATNTIDLTMDSSDDEIVCDV